MQQSYEETSFMLFLIDVFYYLGLFIPPVCLMGILKKMLLIFPNLSEDPATSIYAVSSDEIGGNLIIFLVSGIAYLLACILIDLNIFTRIIDLLDIKEQKYPSSEKMDSDVSNEVEKVFSLTESDLKKKNLVAMKISKFFGNFLAVNRLSFCVEPGECFGL
jgi:hypothetical protein